MEEQLRGAGVRYERWPALRGSPALLRSHKSYFSRGVERHLYANHSIASGTIVQWGTVGTYLSHLTLFEAIVRRWAHNASASVLILQDDTQLHPQWLGELRGALTRHAAQGRPWERLLLVWWGLERPQECGADGWCRVRPPAGPTEPGQPECCGKRFYHGLQAWLVRVSSLRCLVRRLRRRHIKNIDAQMVNCHCPHTYALQHGRMIGAHLDRQMGSERAAVNTVWRSRLDDGGGGAGAPATAAGPGGGRPHLKRGALRNLRKTGMTHLWDSGGVEQVREQGGGE